MNTPDSMNSSRPFDKNERQMKELINEKEEKIKELIEKNEKLEKDCLKFKLQIKSVEDKLKLKMEKEYVTNMNTSSNFLLPSEFRKTWEDLANQTLSDCFIDFYDNPVHTFHLVQELFYQTFQLFKLQIQTNVQQIMGILNLDRNDKTKSQVIENQMKPIYQEYFNFIFDSSESEDSNNKNSNKSPNKSSTGTSTEIFLLSIKKSYTDFVMTELQDFKKKSEFEDMIKSKYFKDLISTIKKILLYIEFHDPPLNLKIVNYKERKIEISKLKNSECICVEGLIKDEKNCLIILNPPTMKNGFVYQGLKPVVILYEQSGSENNNTANSIPTNILVNLPLPTSVPLSQNLLTDITSATIVCTTGATGKAANSAPATGAVPVTATAPATATGIATGIAIEKAPAIATSENNKNSDINMFILNSKTISKRNSMNNSKQNSSSSLVNNSHNKIVTLIPNSQRVYQNKNKITSTECVLNISDSPNSELEMEKPKEIIFIRSERGVISNFRERIKPQLKEVGNLIENVKNNSNFVINEAVKSNPQISIEDNSMNNNNTYNIDNIKSMQINSNNTSSFYSKIDAIIQNKLTINPEPNNMLSNHENSFNNRSTSHHNLFSKVSKKKIQSARNELHANTTYTGNNKNNNNNPPSSSKTKEKVERNMLIQNLNGIINSNGSVSSLKHLINTSRSKYESINHAENRYDVTDDNIENDLICNEANLVDNIENFDIDVNEGFNTDEERLSTDHNYRVRSNIRQARGNGIGNNAQLSNSFTVKKKSDLVISYADSNLNAGGVSALSDNNMTEFYQKPSKVTKILIHNSDKKKNKGNLYLLQSTDRGAFDMNTLTKTIEKLGKFNPMFFSSGFKKKVIRSLSKTPKQNKPQVIGYSPRNNIQYVFNDGSNINITGNKQQMPNGNFIIKVKRKKSSNGNLNSIITSEIVNDENKTGNSKNSSISKENTNNKNIINRKSKTNEFEPENICKISSKNGNNLHRYKDFVKGKMKSNTNTNSNSHTICSNVNASKSNTLNSVNSISNQKNKNNVSIHKASEEIGNKKRIIQKDYGNSNNSAKKTKNKSIDRRVLTNAQTKLCVDDLLSFKKSEKTRGSPTYVVNREKTMGNNEAKYSKTNFLNIKYV